MYEFQINEEDSVIVIALAALSQHRTGRVVLNPKLTVRVRAMTVSNRGTLQQSVSIADGQGIKIERNSHGGRKYSSLPRNPDH